MNYYIDTEYLNGTQKKKILGLTYGQTKPFIDLISIGIVSEDNREYYAISKEFNLREAWDRFENILIKDNGAEHESRVYWIRENVLFPIWVELYCKDRNLPFDIITKYKSQGTDFNDFTYKDFKYLINKYGKTNKQIAEEIKEFIDGCECFKHQDKECKGASDFTKSKVDYNPQFYTYYGAFDWVVFCWLFGKMIDLPSGFPKYCNDLKQELDEKVLSLTHNQLNKIECSICTHDVLSYLRDTNKITLDFRLKLIKEKHPDYPKQANEHNAIADARWNKQLHDFLNNL